MTRPSTNAGGRFPPRRGPDGRFLPPLKVMDERAQIENLIWQILQGVPQVAAQGGEYLNGQMRVLIDPMARLEAAMLLGQRRKT
jgi:hypothetical protein